MEKFLIQGLAGKKSLKGAVRIDGAKNAALKAMAAAILFDGPVRLRNVPHNDDVHTLAEILRKLGAQVSWNKESGAKDSVMEIDANDIFSTEIDGDLACKMRASVVLTGPLLARFGRAVFPAPGGCVIGARPIDLFIDGYKSMGAAVEENGMYDIKAADGVEGAEIKFKKISVGATETLMMAAVLAKGRTVLMNCAREPEIANVAEWLNACGARIRGAGSQTLTIEGTGGKLLKPAADYVAIPDRIAAGSFLILGALCAEELAIEGCRPDHLKALIDPLKASGVPIETTGSSIVIKGNTEPSSSFKAFDVTTKEYPGFVTDLQPMIAAYLTQVSGRSKVVETIYEDRLKYVADLERLGADVKAVNHQEISIKGPKPIRALPAGEELRALDIRAGFTIVMAALCGTGTFTVGNIQLIDRGYEKLEERLSALGAQIKRIVV